jgi:hypothetical protein
MDNLQQARSIYLQLGLTRDVEDCDRKIQQFKTKVTTTKLQKWWLWFAGGLAIVAIIWWLKK